MKKVLNIKKRVSREGFKKAREGNQTPATVNKATEYRQTSRYSNETAATKIKKSNQSLDKY